MNGIVKGFYRTGWRPTYYGIQDYLVYEECQQLFLEDTNQMFFVADWITKKGYEIPRLIPFCFLLDFTSIVHYLRKLNCRQNSR
jgi:hypothetical protein